MKKIFPLLILFVCSTAIAQDYREGYIVRSPSDTIRGQIAYQSFYGYLSNCQFKNGQTVQQLFPEDIKGYGLSNGRFFIAGINEGKFVEAHVIGELSLFQADSSFFLQKGSEKYELRSGWVQKELAGREGVAEDTKWKGIVSMMIGDCINNPMERLSSTKLQAKPMSNLVMEYNKCRDVDYLRFESSEKGMKIKLGLTAGYTSSKVSIKDDQDARGSGFPDIVGINADSYTSVDPTLGLSAEIIFLRNSELLSMHLEMIYSRASYQGYSEFYLQNLYRSDTYFAVSTISIPAALKVSHTIGGKNRIFADLGLNFDILISEESILALEEDNRAGVISMMEDRTMFGFRTVQGGVYLGAGIMRELGPLDFGINFRYFYLPEFDDHNGLTASNTKMNLGIILRP